MANSLTAFELLRLKSERMRGIGMLFMLVVMTGIGLYYMQYMPDTRAGLGSTIIIMTLIFAVFEIAFMFVVENAIRQGKMPDNALWYFEMVIESLIPVLSMAMIIDVMHNPFITLVSPAYALIIIIIAASSLRLSPCLTVVTGVFSAVCYSVLVFWVLYVGKSEYQNPYSTILYINMAIMILVATAVMFFVTREMRRYVDVTILGVAMGKELELASHVQKNLLPSPVPSLPGYEISAFSTPATQTGGDYYDVVITQPNHAIVTLADVSGHGIGPALLMATCRAYIRGILNHEQNLASVMTQANHLLCDHVSSGRFVTLAALSLDADNHQAEYLSAGHAPTLLMRDETGEIESLPAQAMPMGITTPLSLDDAVRIDFKVGDILVMFSDGYYEWKNAAGEQFGIARLKNLLHKHRYESASKITAILQDAIRAFAQEQPQKDDVTTLIVKRVE